MTKRANTPLTIRRMARYMPPGEIARVTGVPYNDVVAAIRRYSRTDCWVARCRKTGREYRSPTERGAYFRAQLLGLTDYDLVGVLKSGELT